MGKSQKPEPEPEPEPEPGSGSESEEEEEEEEESAVEKWKKHYSSKHRILLVGEGDFSFALSLARAFGTARNIVATSLDSPELIASKYRDGVRHVRELQSKGCLVLHEVDAKQMSKHFFLSTQRFDRIVYNFPHVGFLYREGSFCQIQLNKQLLKGYLSNAKELLRDRSGEIHVTNKDGDPYDKWELVKKADKIGLVLQDAVPFRRDDYPGYNNKRAHGSVPDDAFLLGDCSTYVFKMRPTSGVTSNGCY